MIKNQLIARGIKDEAVLEAMQRVKRHLFVSETDRLQAYGDFPLPIGHNQTISQPYMVAVMTERLRLRQGEGTVLEVGTGSGYQTAILAEIASEVVTVERISALSNKARQRLTGLGYNNIRYIVGDGALGCPEYAPYDAIVVTAAAAHVPRLLVEQLRDDGRLVMPVGGASSQTLQVLTRVANDVHCQDIVNCVFVPLISETI
ncbi:MAG: protein-L-isoaspartate(D-aspartate) O-methyltransferase [Candidatus Omnitrophica bacterium]|nr:protein-L-isoaspartate(D-aspartate) O-methyltransferase [Candidatus Omnitrophota bacterium]